MAKKREERYSTAGALAADVVQVARTAHSGAEPAGVSCPRAWLWVSLAVVRLLLLGGAGLGLRNGRSTAPADGAATAQPMLVTTASPAATERPNSEPTSTLAGSVDASPGQDGPPRFRLNQATDLSSWPDVPYGKVANLEAGAEMEVLGYGLSGNWYNVRLDDGRLGFVTRTVGSLLDPPSAARILPAGTVPAPPSPTAPHLPQPHQI